MTLQQLRYILAIEETGSFSGAAELCNVAQPSLSVQVKKLEEELGVTLFDRSPQKKAIITEVGAQILAQAKEVFRQISLVEDLAHSQTKKVHGSLRLGLIPTISPFLLKCFIRELVQKYSELEVRISEAPTRELIHKLNHGSLDLAVLSAPNEAPQGLIEKTLYYEPFFVFAARDHFLLKKTQVKRAELGELSPSLLDETHCLRDQVEGLCFGKTRVASSVQFSQGTLGSLISIVETQGSFTLLPALALELLTPQQQKHQVRPIAAAPAYRKVSLIYHRHFAKPSLTEAVYDAITKHLPQGVSTQVKNLESVIEPTLDRFETE
ncbi:MAG: LysR substrate-binding domain-containing protein [Proteobacteria bacterium]|jgi:LysR family hydrogen peroxide-inducible transcriptional activator|nr:LysR substrate-binding domain-containing protein [Pseudomonadota bacterium]